MPEEARKEIAAGTDEIFYPRGFDPFNYLVQQLNNMDTRWETRFSKVETQFTELEKKFEGRFAELEKKFEGRFTDLEKKFEGRFNELDNKYENRFTRIETEMGTLRQAIGILREEMHREFRSVQRWSFGTIAAVIVGFVGVIASLLAILARLP
ncbi:Uncharacterized [Moorella glycerini]|uniref:Apolipoprotein A1/A4/E domain protein n=1 Tax=Neomoorella stamsii TaxID=1266720 RepID=A0A9X7P5D3_9FIRM|nr:MULTISPECIES: hypothetical protein [Moorella]PRR70408.1 hypothetical protein MOST_28000 [Moorella stamsii]CEP66413.1 Uncharacterized [Moorella glycerini]